MPTINSMLQKNNLIANVSQRYFKLDMDAADKSVLVGGVIRTGANFLKSDFGGQPALTNLIENYSADREDFQERIQDKLDTLQESSDKLKNSVQEEEKISSEAEKTSSSNSAKISDKESSTLSNFNKVANEKISPRAKILEFKPQTKEVEDNSEKDSEQDEKVREEKLNSAKSKQSNVIEFAKNYLVSDDEDKQGMLPEFKFAEDEKISAVKNFVRDFNATLSYLNENSSMSNKISALASNFSGSEELSASLKEIGIDISSYGKLTVNEPILKSAIERNPEAVSELLGNGGLAGQLDRVLNLANYQSENLFPTIEQYTGDEEFEAWENLYAMQNFSTANYAQQKSGKILNMFS